MGGNVSAFKIFLHEKTTLKNLVIASNCCQWLAFSTKNWGAGAKPPTLARKFGMFSTQKLLFSIFWVEQSPCLLPRACLHLCTAKFKLKEQKEHTTSSFYSSPPPPQPFIIIALPMSSFLFFKWGLGLSPGSYRFITFHRVKMTHRERFAVQKL